MYLPFLMLPWSSYLAKNKSPQYRQWAIDIMSRPFPRLGGTSLPEIKRTTAAYAGLFVHRIIGADRMLD